MRVQARVEIHTDFRQTDEMKGFTYVLLMMATLLLAGCKHQVPKPWEPTEAQPKLPTIKIYLGPETLDAEMALTPMETQTGMMFRTNIQDSDSMIFLLPYPMRADFWMKNCPESISAAYINTDGIIEEIHHLEKNDTNGVVANTDDIRFVLETSDGWFQRHNISAGTVIRTEKGSLADTFLRSQQ
jgi:uncharacterized membrane protein (UPF0127 family)